MREEPSAAPTGGLPAPGEAGGAVLRGMAALFDRVAATYGIDEEGGVEFFSHFGRRLVAIAGVAEGQRLLDLGAGRGAVLFAAADVVGPTGFVTGIDLATEMVRLTDEDIRRLGLHNAEMLHGDASAPAFGAGAFDVILGGLVAFFLPDQERAFACHHRLLCPGGRLALSTFAETPDDIQVLANVVRRFVSPTDVASPPESDAGPVIGPARMAAALRAAGFDHVQSTVEEHVVTFRDRDHWWRWQWSHGPRGLLERVPAASSKAFRQAIDEQLLPLCGPDGSLDNRTVMRYTIARRPAPPAKSANDTQGSATAA